MLDKILIIAKDKSGQVNQYTEDLKKANFSKIIEVAYDSVTEVELPEDLPLYKGYTAIVTGANLPAYLLAVKLLNEGIETIVFKIGLVPFNGYKESMTKLIDETLPKASIPWNEEYTLLLDLEREVFKNQLEEFLPVHYLSSLKIIDRRKAEIDFDNKDYPKIYIKLNDDNETVFLKISKLETFDNNIRIGLGNHVRDFNENTNTISLSWTNYESRYQTPLENVGKELNRALGLIMEIQLQRDTSFDNFEQGKVINNMYMGNMLASMFNINYLNARRLLKLITNYCKDYGFEAYIKNQDRYRNFAEVIMIDDIGNQLNLIVNLTSFEINTVEVLNEFYFNIPTENFFENEVSIEYKKINSDILTNISNIPRFKTFNCKFVNNPVSRECLDDLVTNMGTLTRNVEKL